MVPIGRRFGAILRRKRPAAAASVDRRHLRTVDRENVAVRRVAARVAVGVLQHLHLDAAMKRLAARGDVVGPDKYAGIAARLHVPPLHLHDEILVHAIRAQFADRFAGTDQHTIPDRPRGRRRVHRHPAGKILPVEQRAKPILLSSNRRQRQQQGQAKRETPFFVETHDARRVPPPNRLAKRKAKGRTRLNCKTTENNEYTKWVHVSERGHSCPRIIVQAISRR